MHKNTYSNHAKMNQNKGGKSTNIFYRGITFFT